jgi:GNAT acetyltransferase-like protein
MLQIKIASIEEINNSRETWNSLVRSMKLPTVFLSWEWITIWLKHFEKLYEPVIVFIYSDSKIKAIIPLSKRPMRLRTRLFNYQVISFCGSIELYPDHLDVICAEENADIYVTMLFDFFLNTYTKWDVMHLPFLAGDGHLAKWLQWNSKKHKTIQSDEIIAPFLKVENNFETFLGGLERKKRYNLMREKNILFKNGVSLTKVSDKVELETGLKDLFLLHNARAGEKKITSTFSKDAVLNFHREIARIFLEIGWLRLFLLKKNDSGEAISAAYGFVHEKRFNYYQTGLDPIWLRFSPGKILIYKMLEDMYHSDITEFDFLGGNDNYKTYWTRDYRVMRTYSVFNKNIMGNIEFRADILFSFLKSLSSTITDRFSRKKVISKHV